MSEHLKHNVPKRHIERARRLRKVDSICQRKLWSAVRGRKLNEWKFRREFPIDPYTGDFACMAASLIVEIDGESHDYSAEEDALRTKVIESHGFEVIRFRNEDVLFNFESVLEAIVDACERRARPSP